MALLATLIAPGCDNTATNQPPSEAPPVADVRIEPAQPPAPSQIAQEDSKWEETQKKSAQAWDATREAGSSAWDATKETSAEAWDTTKEKSSETWQATKETSRNLAQNLLLTRSMKIYQVIAPGPEHDQRCTL
jgi:hypothetical protein